MNAIRTMLSTFVYSSLLLTVPAPVFAAEKTPPPVPSPGVVLPMDRTAYFLGERVPLAFSAVAADAEVKLEAVNADGRLLLYQGKPATLLLETANLAPGDYVLDLNGARVLERLTITSPLRRSAASLQDEALPPDSMKPDDLAQTLKQSGITALVGMGAADFRRARSLDTLARTGTLMLVNPDTRPTSFFPVGNWPAEQDGMSQRMILSAQANGRYPNFGGFCFGWDTTGYAIGARKGLMTYWGWGDKTQALRNYIARLDKFVCEEFTRRTGLVPVTEAEYIAYLLSIQRPEFATMIDAPTRQWLQEIARYTKPMGDRERAEFEKRLNAWSDYLMGIYNEAYGVLAKNLRSVDRSLKNTASVQVDHTAVRYGQYFPWAYSPLDLQYQTTWNDQVGGPDYAYQWLFTAGLLEMQRNDKPTWISNALGAAHGRSHIPGKFPRVAAHGLAYGGSGIGFALEGFSNVLGGMNRETNWNNIKGKAGEADLAAGREFLDRFAALALEGRGDHGVGILFSKSQYHRQHIVMGFGTTPYQALVALVRLGYTPRFVTELDLLVGQAKDIKALLVLGQTFPLPANVVAAIDDFAKAGGRVLVDGSTSIELPHAEKLGYTFAFTHLGKPHNWMAPNMLTGENDATLYARWHAQMAPALAAALGDTGRGLYASEKGPEAKVSLLQIDGGPDAKYVVAVNDSHIQTQADWHQVRETIAPTRHAPADAVVYDATDERGIGKIGPLPCDLTMTTVRVLAVLPRPLGRIDLSATQTVRQTEPLILAVRFLDGAGKPLAAVLPFQLSVVRPDGKLFQEFYRSTDCRGAFSMAIPVGANSPAGTWTVAVRSQLTGEVVSLPVSVAARPAQKASVWNDRVIVRQKAAIEQALIRGGKLVLPVFDAPQAEQLMPVAEKVEQVLAGRGVDVEIRRNPAIVTYTLSYDPTDDQKQDNGRAERGEALGKIKRETVNGNDWYAAMSGWHFGRPVILLDLATEKGDNPMAESLSGQSYPLQNVGILWPQVSADFPGKGRAVVQGVPWAFAPRTTAIVIQAADVEGLMAGAAALANLPEDKLTPFIQSAKEELWRQYHVGGRPGGTRADSLTSQGAKNAQSPQPFRIQFPGDKPLPADRVPRPAPVVRTVYAVPGTFEPKQFLLLLRDGDKYTETATVEFLMPDLRFSDAIMLLADVKQPGKTRLVAEGVFRYSDRPPMWQAQWEDLLALRDKLVPKERRPLEFEVLLGGKPAGKLTPARVEQKEMPLEMASHSAGLKPRTSLEEVVTRLEGTVELPAGRQEIILVPRNIVDGKLRAVGVGCEPPPPPALAPPKK